MTNKNEHLYLKFCCSSQVLSKEIDTLTHLSVAQSHPSKKGNQSQLKANNKHIQLIPITEKWRAFF
jgi:hypothetical protein